MHSKNFLLFFFNVYLSNKINCLFQLKELSVLFNVYCKLLEILCKLTMRITVKIRIYMHINGSFNRALTINFSGNLFPCKIHSYFTKNFQQCDKFLDIWRPPNLSELTPY